MSKTLNGRSVLDTRRTSDPPSLSEASKDSASGRDKDRASKQLAQAQRRVDQMNEKLQQNSMRSSPELSSEALEEYPEALRREILDLQQALIDKFRGQHKLVSGAQFRGNGPAHAAKCEQCEAKDVSLKKAKETVRSLRFQLSQAEDKLFGGKAGGASGPTSRSDVVVSALKEENEDLARRVSALERDNTNLSQLLEIEKIRLEKHRRHSFVCEDEELSERVKKRCEESEQKYKDLLDSSAENQVKMIQLKEQLNLKCAYAKGLEDDLEVARQRPAAPSPKKAAEVEERLNRAEGDNQALRGEVEALQRQYQDLCAKSEADLAELRRSTQLEKDRSSQQLDEAQQSVTALRGEGEQATLLIDRMRKEADAAQDDAQRLKQELDLLRALADQKLARTRDLEADLVTLRKEADEANNKMSSMLKRMTAESESSAKAIQKAISSSVRLCVVAPTVNVHVADKKMKFRTNIPKEDLECFLRDRVLSKYTFLFEQAQDNCAPDGVTDLQPWIKKVLAEMQESVENHISSAMKSGGSNGS